MGRGRIPRHCRHAGDWSAGDRGDSRGYESRSIRAEYRSRDLQLLEETAARACMVRCDHASEVNPCRLPVAGTLILTGCGGNRSTHNVAEDLPRGTSGSGIARVRSGRAPVAGAHGSTGSSSRDDERTPRSPGRCGGLEQLDQIAGGVREQNLATTRAADHIAAKGDTGVA